MKSNKRPVHPHTFVVTRPVSASFIIISLWYGRVTHKVADAQRLLDSFFFSDQAHIMKIQEKRHLLGLITRKKNRDADQLTVIVDNGRRKFPYSLIFVRDGHVHNLWAGALCANFPLVTHPPTTRKREVKELMVDESQESWAPARVRVYAKRWTSFTHSHTFSSLCLLTVQATINVQGIVAWQSKRQRRKASVTRTFLNDWPGH